MQIIEKKTKDMPIHFGTKTDINSVPIASLLMVKLLRELLILNFLELLLVLTYLGMHL